VHDLVHYNIEKIVKPECRDAVFEFFHIPDVYMTIDPLEGAVEAMKELVDAGHDIVICSATASEEHQKKAWMAQHFPFIDRKHIIFGHRKEKLYADVFIDDAPKNIEAYRKRWPSSKILTIAYPYNEDHKHLVDLYARGFDDTAAAWKAIVAKVHEIADGRQ
jgi:5'(3')-deoxyribonucleotidase